MEGVPTRKQGIFVMPLERITIHSTFMIYVADPQDTVATAWSFRECGAPRTQAGLCKLAWIAGAAPVRCHIWARCMVLVHCWPARCARADFTEARLDSLLVELQATRERCLPG